jgi:hypothetical protein
MSWYETAKNSIFQTKIDNPDISREELKKRCSENYPFGERKRHPYKAWLKAMKDEFGSKKRLKQAQKIGQEDMFV